MASISLHCGGSLVARDVAEAVETPPGTNTHKPVPHKTVITEVHAEIARRGLPIAKEQYALSCEGQRLFGLIDITDGPGMPDGMGVSLGFRNAHDKAWALGLAGGTRVFICDNLVFSGDVVRYRKHTSRIDAAKVIEGVMELVLEETHDFAAWMEGMKSIQLTDLQAKEIVIDMWDADALPIAAVKPAWHMYRDAADPARLVRRVGERKYLERVSGVGTDGGDIIKLSDLYGERTLWSLYNCCTEAFKPLRMDNQLRRSARLNPVFQRVYPLPPKAAKAALAIAAANEANTEAGGGDGL
jgi:hypothetical protein